MTAESTLKLPPIPLEALSEKTKDFILARASYRKCSPEEVMLEVLDHASGYTPPATPVAQSQPEGLAA